MNHRANRLATFGQQDYSQTLAFQASCLSRYVYCKANDLISSVSQFVVENVSIVLVNLLRIHNKDKM